MHLRPRSSNSNSVALPIAPRTSLRSCSVRSPRRDHTNWTLMPIYQVRFSLSRSIHTGRFQPKNAYKKNPSSQTYVEPNKRMPSIIKLYKSVDYDRTGSRCIITGIANLIHPFDHTPHRSCGKIVWTFESSATICFKNDRVRVFPSYATARSLWAAAAPSPHRPTA